MSSEYRPDRRATAVPKLNAVTKNEAAEVSDLQREKRLERAWEEISADLRRQKDGTKKRSFSDLVKKK